MTRPQVLRLAFGAGYVLMGVVGVAVLLVPSARSEADRDVSVFLGSLLALVGAGGLVQLVFVRWFDRHRPGPVVDTAPSGLPAIGFRRSAFLTTTSVTTVVALAGWLGALAFVLHGVGHDVWAAVTAVCAVGLLAVLVPVVTGRVETGGLWLTQSGLEYRRDAVGWALPWSALQNVEPTPERWTVVGVMPFTGGRPVPVQPLVLRLVPGARLEVRRTTRRSWSRECRMPQGAVCVDCFDLAGGPSLIAETVEHYRLFPELRAHLGTAASVPRAV
jgi:hypothetical protein